MSASQIQDVEIEKSCLFLSRIGIQLSFTCETPASFVPGVWINNEQIYCNCEQLRCVGDLLHEAGHLAVTPQEMRARWLPGGFDFHGIEDLSPLLKDGTENPLSHRLINGDEQAAITWSYAAAIEIGIDVYDMHLDTDFDGEWEPTVLSLQLKCHAGVNNLQRIKMTTKQIFPKMLRWLQV